MHWFIVISAKINGKCSTESRDSTVMSTSCLWSVQMVFDNKADFDLDFERQSIIKTFILQFLEVWKSIFGISKHHRNSLGQGFL